MGITPPTFHSADAADGHHVAPGISLGTIRGGWCAILSCERVLLNFVQRLSGVATLTRRFTDAVEGTGSKASAEVIGGSHRLGSIDRRRGLDGGARDPGLEGTGRAARGGSRARASRGDTLGARGSGPGSVAAQRAFATPRLGSAMASECLRSGQEKRPSGYVLGTRWAWASESPMFTMLFSTRAYMSSM